MRIPIAVFDDVAEMTRINVLWVIDHVCYDGDLHGGGRLYWNVLPRFDPNRFRVVPCMLRASDTIRQVFTTSPSPVRILNKGKFDPTTLWTFLRLIRQEKIHLMHLHCYGASTFGRVASLITAVPAVIHDYDTEIYFPYPWYLGLADRLLAPRTQHAIAASPMVAEFLIRKRNISPERIHMLFHAVPAEKYTSVPRQRVSEIRRCLRPSNGTKIVATLTKLGPQRGNDFFLRAAAETLKTSPEVLFLLIYKPTYFHRLPSKKYVHVSDGDTAAEVKELEALATELNIRNKVRFVKWPDNIDDWVSCCDLIVAPFLSERFSSTYLLEVMAKGKPVVGTDLGEQREIIQNGVNGYRVAPGDVQALGQKISEVLRHPLELDRLGTEAALTSRQYSAESYVQKLQQIYEEIACQHESS